MGDHYRHGDIECIDAIKSATESLGGFVGFCVGNIIKYVWRFAYKGGYSDLCKAEDYLHRLMDFYGGEQQ